MYQDGSESHYEDERLTDWLQSLMGQRQEVLIYREDPSEHRPHLKQLNKVDADIAHAFPLYINDDPVGIPYADVRHADEYPVSPSFREMVRYLCGLIAAALTVRAATNTRRTTLLPGYPTAAISSWNWQNFSTEPHENWRTGGLIILDLDDLNGSTKRVAPCG